MMHWRSSCCLVAVLRQSAAVFLIALLLSPFTAPFATCDRSTPIGTHAPLHRSDSAVESSAARPISMVAASSRIRFAAFDQTPLALFGGQRFASATPRLSTLVDSFRQGPPPVDILRI